MSVKVNSNTPKLLIDNQRNVSVFLRLMSEGIVRTAEPNTPKRFNTLRKSTRIQVLGPRAVIRWLAKYAIYQEVKQFKNYTTPGTGPHFARNAVRRETSRAMVYAKKAGLI